MVAKIRGSDPTNLYELLKGAPMANGSDIVKTGELKPGKKTTELVITWVVTILGFAQVVLGAILAAKGGNEGLAVTLEIIGSEPSSKRPLSMRRPTLRCPNY